MSEIKSFKVALPEDKSVYDCYFSNGMEYIANCDRGYWMGKSKEEYYNGFTERDYLLDAAIERGNDLHLDCNLWRIYDDAVNNYGLNPIDPYDWLFVHATLSNKSIVISKPRDRILLLYGCASMGYYDFIHGMGKYFERYSRPIE